MTHTHTCTFVQIQADYTAVELAKDTHTIEVLKAAGATMPEIPDQVLAFVFAACVRVPYVYLYMCEVS